MGPVFVYVLVLWVIIAFVRGANCGAHEDAEEESAHPPLWWVAIFALGNWLVLQRELFPERWCKFACRVKMFCRPLSQRMTEAVRRGWRLVGTEIE